MVLFQRGSNFLRGVPNAYFYKKTIQLMIFQWGGLDPYSPSGSAHA